MLVAETDPDAVLWLLAADHVIADTAALHHSLAIAAAAARTGRIVTFGMRPTAPETGYGYIAVGAALDDAPGAYAVAQFVEKPDAANAARLATDGKHLWNSGMFVFTARTLLEELETHAPDVLRAVRRAVAERTTDLDFIRLGVEAFTACPSISLDYAVAERTSRAAVVPADIGWSDVGSWNALWELGAQGRHRATSRSATCCWRPRATATSAATACWPPWSGWRTRWSWSPRTPCWRCTATTPRT